MRGRGPAPCLPVCLFPGPQGHSGERAAPPRGSGHQLGVGWEVPSLSGILCGQPVVLTHQVSSSLGIGEFPKTSDPETECSGQAPLPRPAPTPSFSIPSPVPSGDLSSLKNQRAAVLSLWQPSPCLASIFPPGK